jgi:hypothetical protein
LIQQSFAAEFTRRCESDTLNDTRVTSYHKIPSLKTVNDYGVSKYVVYPSNPDLSLELPSASSKEREELPAHS